MRTSQKALEEVNALIEGIDNYEEQTGEKNPPVYISKELLVKIQQSLNRLEFIENAKPSDALETLENMGNYVIPTRNGQKFLKDFYKEELETIKNYILKVQEEKLEQAVIDYLEMEYRW